MPSRRSLQLERGRENGERGEEIESRRTKDNTRYLNTLLPIPTSRTNKRTHIYLLILLIIITTTHLLTIPTPPSTSRRTRP
jgi:hypothetical protein